MYCNCLSCGRRFTGTTNFDAHRTGKYPHRRCMTEPELLESMYMNSRGAYASNRTRAVYPENRHDVYTPTYPTGASV